MGLGDEILLRLMEKALMHDMEEVWTGDIPSPHKEHLRRTGGSPCNTHMGVGTYAPGMLSEGEGEPPVGSGIHQNTVVDDIVRAADRIDAWQWSQKYVLDQFVKEDCLARLTRFMNYEPNNSLCGAMNTIVKKL